METLVLDVGYQPIRQVPWQTAIVWTLEKIVEVVDEHPDRHINTVNWSVKMPSVVRFLKPIAKKKAVKFSRGNIYLRDKGRCQYCATHVSRDRFTYEHVIPRAQGGRTEWTNVVVACHFCNQKKAARTPEQAGMKLLSTPVKPKKLPDMPHRMSFVDGMPTSWKDWLRSEVYWSSTLEQS